MEQTKWKPFNLQRMDISFFIGIAFVFLLRILLLFSPIREDNVTNAYLAPLIIAMMVYLLERLGFPYSPVVLLPAVFAVWFLLSRILNGDWYLHESYTYVYMALLSCCVIFPAPFLASREQRGKLLKVIALVYSLSFGIIAWLAVIAAFTGVPWVNPLDSNSILGINQTYADPYRLNVLGMHPNISAIFFYTSLSLLFYLYFHRKHLWLRIGYGVLAAGLYLAICMTGSVSAIFITSLIIGLTVFAVIANSKRIVKMRIFIAILAMLIVMGIVIGSYPIIIQCSTGIYKEVQRLETVGAEQKPVSTGMNENIQEQKTVEGEQEQMNGETDVTVFAEQRYQTEIMAGNMRSRFLIYSSAFLSIADRPITLLIGELQQDAMDRSAKVIDFPYQNHLHNSFLQTLVVGGGISFLISLAFTVLLIIHGIRLFVHRSTPLSLKMLVLAPAALLCHSMTEAILFVDARLPNMLFFFLSGMIIAYSLELRTDKDKQEKKLVKQA